MSKNQQKGKPEEKKKEKKNPKQQPQKQQPDMDFSFMRSIPGMPTEMFSTNKMQPPKKEAEKKSVKPAAGKNVKKQEAKMSKKTPAPNKKPVKKEKETDDCSD
jgi:hypothetical protein